jgi:hypothetical protein
MTTAAPLSAQYNQSTAIKDRAPEDIRAALKERDEDIVGAALKLAEYARKHSLGLTPLAHKSKIATSILSQYFNGRYAGDYGEIAKRIEKFFWDLGQKELYGGIREFVKTRLAAVLWSVFEKTRIVRRIQPVEGPEQVGKSRAAVEYAERNNTGRTVYIKLSGGTKSGCGDFIWDLAEILGLPYTIKLREKRLRIKHALVACDLVIVDEAHLVFSWADRAQMEFWDYLRTDAFDDGARGIVMLFTNQAMLSGLQPWRRRCKYNVGQLLGRMQLDPMVIVPGKDIVEDDVRALAERYYKPGRAVINRLHREAMKDQLGHFGLVIYILNESWSRAKARKTKLSDDIVTAVADETREMLKGRKELYE